MRARTDAATRVRLQRATPRQCLTRTYTGAMAGVAAIQRSGQGEFYSCSSAAGQTVLAQIVHGQQLW
jgi:hypothetical protein